MHHFVLVCLRKSQLNPLEFSVKAGMMWLLKLSSQQKCGILISAPFPLICMILICKSGFLEFVLGRSHTNMHTNFSTQQWAAYSEGKFDFKPSAQSFLCNQNWFLKWPVANMRAVCLLSKARRDIYTINFVFFSHLDNVQTKRTSLGGEGLLFRFIITVFPYARVQLTECIEKKNKVLCSKLVMHLSWFLIFLK